MFSFLVPPSPTSGLTFNTPEGSLDCFSPTHEARKKPIQRVELLRELGTGTYAKVFDAIVTFDDETTLPCAAKQIRDPTAGEANKHMKLTSQRVSAISGLVSALGEHEINGKKYLLMAKGEFDLESMIDRIAALQDTNPTLHHQVLSEFFRDMCRTLFTFQAANGVHADIKPANLIYMVRENESFWSATDFGQTTAVGTADSMMRGSFGYASPEAMQLEPNKELTMATDVFSYGAIFMRLIGIDIEGVTEETESGDQRCILKKPTLLPSDPEYIQLIKVFICGMIQYNPSERPTLETIKKFCEQFCLRECANDVRAFYMSSPLTLHPG